MRLSLFANAALAPILTPLSALSPHETSTVLLSSIPSEARRQLRTASQNAFGPDALLLLDGMDLLSEDGWQNGDIPLIVPNVHHVVALLLGSDDAYRHLFSFYDGSLCWFLPGTHQEFFCSPQADCQALCYLTDTQMDLPDKSLKARTIAQLQQWDYLEAPCNFSLLESLLGGQWETENTMIFGPGELVQL